MSVCELIRQKAVNFKSTKSNKPPCDIPMLIVWGDVVQHITYEFCCETNTFSPYWFSSENDYVISLDEVSEFAVLG